MKTYPLYLNGQFVETPETVAIHNPASGEPFARMCLLGRSRLAQAIEDAHAAFLMWRGQTALARSQALQRLAVEMTRRAEDLARAITFENGKPLAQSRAETTLSIDHVEWFAGEARRGYGRTIPHSAANKRHLVVKTPLGVVAAISPWNFPLLLAVRKVAPALAAGCTVILKPARQAPTCCAILAECVHAAELPAGVFQLAQGSAPELGAEFLENRLCRKITFTGSTEVGQVLIRGAAAQVKPLSLELGGHGPALVFADVDLAQAVEGVMAAKFRNTGQSCIAANRVLVERPIYERFLEAFTARVRALKVGDGMEAGVEIGPLIDQAAVTKVTGHVRDALARNARLLCGGNPVVTRPGWFFEPTVLADVPDTALCCCEETFGPVAPVSPFDTEEEAVRRANDSNYALGAYVFTRDLSRGFRLMEQIEAGTLGLNDGVPTASQAPFGGGKMSGWGRELGTEGMDAFLNTKHVSIGL